MRRVNPFILSTVSFAALAASPAFGQAGQVPADQAPPQTLTTEQEIESGQNACEVRQGEPLPANCTPSTENAITVTGTRIRRPNLESPLPVTSIGGQEFFQTGNVSVGDKLAELPSIRSTFTQANSTRFLGTAGLNILDLRGLGTARTLVLVNGRRHVGGDVLSTGVGVDVNTIPTDLIDRVDVVTGGNSAVYGSDAIAGVVNFVLKNNYDGIQLRGQGGQSVYGDADSYFISGLIGKNFANGRGNVALNVEYARQDQAWGSQRPWIASNNGFVLVDVDQRGINGPDRLYFEDIHFSPSYSATGVVRFGGPILGGPGTGQPSNLVCGTAQNGLGTTGFYNCPYQFTPSGTLEPITGTRVGLGPNGVFIGGNGEDWRNGHQFQMMPQLDRYNINALAHFEVSPALVPFIEATASRTDASGTGSSGPAFMSGSTLGDPAQFFFSNGNRERLRLDNPFLDPNTSDFIASQILTSGINDCTFRALTSTDVARLNAGSYRFCVRENLLGLGNRQEDIRRDMYRVVGGIRGDFDGLGPMHYELSANYGHLKETNKIKGNLNIQRFLLALDAVRDPTTGNIVCASQLGTRAFGYYPYLYSYLNDYYGYSKYPNAESLAQAQARLDADIASCTPINPFGGNFTDAQRAYLLANTVAKGMTSQFDVTGFISGDTSNFLNLWGGPIGFVLGAEYREDNISYRQDELTELGYTFYNAIPSFNPKTSKVKEAFGEISIPLIKDKPGIRELEIDAAARVSDYNLGTTGTVWAYNVNALYSPMDGLRFRGNYARAVRAPNQVELLSPPGQNYFGISDPCSVQNIGSGTQNRAANCAAAGIPAGTNIIYNQTPGYLSGGNPKLEAEKSDSWTLGGVFTPRFVPGFSLSVDYYNITVNNAIAFVGPNTILAACYDLPSFPNTFCSQFKRAGPSGGPKGESPYALLDNSLLASPLNYAKLTARGIDTEIAFRRQIGRIGRFDSRFTYTHVIDRSNFVSATDPNFKDVQLLELGDPQDAFNWNSSLQHGRFTLGYQMRFIGKMVVASYETFFPVQGRPAQDPDYADRHFYPSVFYHDLRLAADVGPKYNFYIGVDNLTNKHPPLGLTGIGGGSAIYDSRGRFGYAGFVAKF